MGSYSPGRRLDFLGGGGKKNGGPRGLSPLAAEVDSQVIARAIDCMYVYMYACMKVGR